MSPETDGSGTGLRDRSLRRPDGRTVAWAEVGPEDGRAIVSFPGTPTSRYAIRSDLRAYLERDVRMIVTERPGLGASTRLAAHGFLEPADDVAAILDDLAIERAHLWGGSGGAPYLLAFAQRHPDRALAATVVSGSAPLNDDEIDDTIPMNAEFSRAALAGDVERLRELAAVRREAILADPLVGFRAQLSLLHRSSGVVGQHLQRYEERLVEGGGLLAVGVQGADAALAGAQRNNQAAAGTRDEERRRPGEVADRGGRCQIFRVDAAPTFERLHRVATGQILAACPEVRVGTAPDVDPARANVLLWIG